jgi:PTS system galactitol-specific IIB component
VKKIIVACSGGLCTSETIASKVRRLLKERGINDVEINAIKIVDIKLWQKSSDIYISVSGNEDLKYDIPTINGIPFLTGVGMQQTLEELIKLIEAP